MLNTMPVTLGGKNAGDGFWSLVNYVHWPTDKIVYFNSLHFNHVASFLHWFHWSLTNSGCLCYWQEPSPFIWYYVPLLWYLLHFGSLKLKGELWKRFSFPSDKIFLFFLFSPFLLEETNFCDSDFAMILQILCDVNVYIFCLCIKTAFSVSCMFLQIAVFCVQQFPHFFV